MRILLVEDDDGLAEAVVEALEDDYYAVDRVADGGEADERITSEPYDLVLLDWSIPPPSGLELLQRWRERGIDTPVLMLTGRGRLEDRVSGLDRGADDYLTKPFAIAELLARTRSLLRRQAKTLQVLRAGDLAMDRAARRVTLDGEEVRFTPKEFGVLEYLLGRRDQAVSRQDLAEHAWDHTFDPASNTLDVIVYRIRKKIDGDRQLKLMHTVSGVGYLLASKRRSGARAD